mmetsp:Transcript_27579/g.38985  ORF Transcript_27579/g.38985 Transcript_27579/m.38985 type:complete len:250 (+) Transcript_27579:71-820(+)|eukprot:CAMPEP_0202442306 /NCGR_PEP_ID=MMETSP1360-20130828/1758_1 /ASSEMBLY_ACC=CAM_ASM_000848 /TAXON_ID=515479 /ORGANISM="Licmophora paradoxa, Strain CCMP2313" /LENGTH=249 /DNA_ID=CAMNT_0049057635 /DNA_START=48 /DNA_END=797 /DNA_ORIENTATION=+
MMKILVSALIASTACAFTAPLSRTVVSQVTELHSSVGVDGPPFDDWSEKKLHKPIDTTPKLSRPKGRQQMKDVILEPNYYLTWCFAAVGFLIMWYHPTTFADGSPSIVGFCGGAFHVLFASLLWVQTRRVRCVFEKDGFEFYNLKGPGLTKLEQKPDNYVSGTRNRWKYDTITNWDFFPSIEYPVIVYFKETETPESQWNKWFAAFDSYGRGQPHFFPGIVNVHQFKEQMELRGSKRKEIPSMKKNKNN